MANDLEMKFGASIGPIVEATNQVKAEMQSVGASVVSVDEAVKGLTESFAVMGKEMLASFGAFAGIEGLMKLPEIVKGVAEIGEMADRLGISVKSLQELQFAAKSTSVDVESLNAGLGFFAKRIGLASQSNTDLAKVLSSNNIALRDASGHIRPLNDLFRDYANLVANAGSAEERALLITTAFGRSAQTLGQMMKGGSDGLDEFAQKADEAGLVTQEETDKAKELNEKFVSLSTTLSTLFKKAAIAASEDMATLWKNTETLSKSFDDLKKSSAGVDEVLDFLLGKGTLDALGSPVVQGGAAPATANVPLPRLRPDTPTDMSAFDKQKAAAAKDALNAQMAAYSEELAAAKSTYAEENSLIQFRLRTHQITLGQEVQAEIAALNQEYDAEHATLEKERNLRGLTLAETQKLDNQIEALKREHALKLQEIEQRAEEQQMAEAGRITSMLTGLWSSSISGLIDGTESWGQAFGKTLDNMLIKFIEMVTQMIVEWAVLEALSLATGIPAPAFASVAHSVMGFAGGSYSVPSTMLAVVHQGEMIIPSGDAAAIRSGTAGVGNGGGGITINVSAPLTAHALDATGLTAVLERHATTIAATVARVMDQNPSLRPSY